MSGSAFAPQVFTPDWSNTSGNSGQGWGQGISAIGQALFPNPNTLAEARLHAAQTGLVGVQTQKAQQELGVGQASITGRQTLAEILSNPNGLSDPNTRGRALAAVEMLPSDQQQSHKTILSAAIQNTNLPQVDKDAFLVGLGSPYGSTSTGAVKLQNLANQPGFAQAAATVTSAKIRSATDLEQQARGGDIILTASGPQVIPHSEYIKGGYTPAPTAPGDQASVIEAHRQSGMPLKEPPNTSTPTSALPPSAPAVAAADGGTVHAPPADNDGSPKPFGSTLTSVINRSQASNLPKEDPQTIIDQKAAGVFGKTSYLGMGGGTEFQLGEHANNAVLQVANNMFRDRGSSSYQNMPAAVSAAWDAIITANKKDLVFDSHMFGKGVAPTVDFSNDFLTKHPEFSTPATALQPNRPVQPVQPEQTPLVSTGKQAITPPPPVRPAPVPAATSTATTVNPPPPQGGPVANRTVDARGAARAAPKIFVGGDPQNAASWRAATQAEVQAAQTSGNLYQ